MLRHRQPAGGLGVAAGAGTRRAVRAGRARRHVHGRVAVEEADRLEHEPDLADRHHRPVLRPHHVVRADRCTRARDRRPRCGGPRRSRRAGRRHPRAGWGSRRPRSAPLRVRRHPEVLRHEPGPLARRRARLRDRRRRSRPAPTRSRPAHRPSFGRRVDDLPERPRIGSTCAALPVSVSSRVVLASQRVAERVVRTGRLGLAVDLVDRVVRAVHVACPGAR